MSKIIGLNINLSKIDKSRIVDGKKGKYLDAVVMLRDQPDQYGNDGMIVQSISKEERDRGLQGEILGNCKILGGGKQQNRSEPNNNPVQGSQINDSFDDMDDSLPF